jgi:hypothetical protein
MTDAQTVTDQKPILAPHQRPFDATAFGLYATVVFSWGFSWIALRAQLGVVSPEVSILWRFIIASGVMWLWVGLGGESLRFPPRIHVFFIGVGVFMFSANFVLFYHGGLTIPSGLLAVVSSLASIGNLLMAALFLGQPIGLRVAIGGLIGAIGIGLLYLPEIAGADFSPAVATGLVLCILGTLSFCAGNIVSGKLQQRGIPAGQARAPPVPASRPRPRLAHRPWQGSASQRRRPEPRCRSATAPHGPPPRSARGRPPLPPKDRTGPRASPRPCRFQPRSRQSPPPSATVPTRQSHRPA